jgi:hypothetical protein
MFEISRTFAFRLESLYETFCCPHFLAAGRALYHTQRVLGTRFIISMGFEQSETAEFQQSKQHEFDQNNNDLIVRCSDTIPPSSMLTGMFVPYKPLLNKSDLRPWRLGNTSGSLSADYFNFERSTKNSMCAVGQHNNKDLPIDCLTL